ncbi:hypothetical protein MASR1M74_19330 [Lentimicrobium sp.]
MGTSMKKDGIVDGADVEVQIFLYTGINSMPVSSLKLYPNPVSTRLFLEGSSVDVIEVYSLSGKMMLSVERPNGFLDLGELESGMYLLRVKSSQQVTTYRVVKK